MSSQSTSQEKKTLESEDENLLGHVAKSLLIRGIDRERGVTIICLRPQEHTQMRTINKTISIPFFLKI